MPKLKNDVTLNLWGSVVTVPKGTGVQLIKNASGTAGDLFAISSVSLLIELTGNSHDPKYRYAFVSANDVEQESR